MGMLEEIKYKTPFHATVYDGELFLPFHVDFLASFRLGSGTRFEGGKPLSSSLKVKLPCREKRFH